MVSVSLRRRGIDFCRIGVLPICMALAGCGEQPPDANDIKAAVNGVLDGFFGTYSPLNNHVIVTDVQALSCTAAEGKPGFICDYDLVELAPNKSGPQIDKKKSARFVKDNDKWLIQKDK